MPWMTFVPLFAISNDSVGAIGWGTLSLINAGLAQSKNRSGLLWWVASLFFGPIATFLIVAVLEPRPAYPMMKGQTGDGLF
jgi:hypothetical protein